MKNLFQTVLLIVFGVLVVIAVLIFADIIPVGKKTVEESAKGTVVVWGLIPKDRIQTLIDSFTRAHQGITLVYVEVDEQTFDQSLAEKISTGQGPDLLFLPQNMIFRQAAKIYKIPYEEFSERSFRDTYIQEGDLLLSSDGIIGIPLVVDPMIMYYNRSLVEAAGFTTPPKTWDDLVSITAPLTTRIGVNNAITTSAVALGGFSNIRYAKDILSLLFLQAGNPIIAKVGDKYMSVLVNQGTNGKMLDSVLGFYTQFADPTKEIYTWNKSLPASHDAFINEQVAIYFGYASELPSISNRNPNLNFDIGRIPQIKDTKAPMTFGRLTSVAVVKTTKNFAAAKYVQQLMAEKEFVSALVSVINEGYPIAPARRDLLTVPPKNLLGPTLYSSALISRGWLDIGESKTNPIFKTMIDDIIRGAVDPAQALSDASSKINNLIQ